MAGWDTKTPRLGRESGSDRPQAFPGRLLGTARCSGCREDMRRAVVASSFVWLFGRPPAKSCCLGLGLGKLGTLFHHPPITTASLQLTRFFGHQMGSIVVHPRRTHSPLACGSHLLVVVYWLRPIGPGLARW